jgi:hypothetical protein
VTCSRDQRDRVRGSSPGLRKPRSFGRTLRRQRTQWLRLFGDDFVVLPDVNRRAVHASSLARDSCGAAECADDGVGEFLARLDSLYPFSFHEPPLQCKEPLCTLSFKL